MRNIVRDPLSSNPPPKSGISDDLATLPLGIGPSLNIRFQNGLVPADAVHVLQCARWVLRRSPTTATIIAPSTAAVVEKGNWQGY